MASESHARPARPLVVSMGDPAGIGPEIIVGAVQQRPALLERLFVAGDVAVMRRTVDMLALRGHVGPEVVELEGPPMGAGLLKRGLRVVQCCDPFAQVVMGRISAVAGRAAAQCITAAARWALLGQTCAMVTAPIHKEAMAAAGLAFPGHTELLQSLAAQHAGVSVAEMPVRMMLSTRGLATVLVSIHVSLSQAIAAVTKDSVLETIRITARHFARCGVPQARIAVAGLNPHAGEGGLFGREEIEHIGPAIQMACGEGLCASGPHAPDTVFMRAMKGEFDVVVAMYHDQGLIPVKLLGLEHGVNTTLGLPLIRTSPDHGTAFNLAGTGRADPSSLLAAIDAALGAAQAVT